MAEVLFSGSNGAAVPTSLMHRQQQHRQQSSSGALVVALHSAERAAAWAKAGMHAAPHAVPTHAVTTYKLVAWDDASRVLSSLFAPGIEYCVGTTLVQSMVAEQAGALHGFSSVGDAVLKEDLRAVRRGLAAAKEAAAAAAAALHADSAAHKPLGGGGTEGCHVRIAKLAVWNASRSQLPRKRGAKLEYSFVHVLGVLEVPAPYRAKLAGGPPKAVAQFIVSGTAGVTAATAAGSSYPLVTLDRDEAAAADPLLQGTDGVNMTAVETSTEDGAPGGGAALSPGVDAGRDLAPQQAAPPAAQPVPQQRFQHHPQPQPQAARRSFVAPQLPVVRSVQSLQRSEELTRALEKEVAMAEQQLLNMRGLRQSVEHQPP